MIPAVRTLSRLSLLAGASLTLTAPALADGGAAPSGGSAFLIQMLPILAMVLIFYFLLIRPQQKRQKALREMIAALQKGDKVVTQGGLIGKVTKVTDAELTIEIAPDTRVQIIRSMVISVMNKDGVAPANDAALTTAKS